MVLSANNKCPWCGASVDGSGYYERWTCGSTGTNRMYQKWQHPECAAFCRGRDSRDAEVAELLDLVQDLTAQACTIDDQESGHPMLAASARRGYEDAIEFLCGRGLLAPVPGRHDRYEWTHKPEEVTP